MGELANSLYYSFFLYHSQNHETIFLHHMEHWTTSNGTLSEQTLQHCRPRSWPVLSDRHNRWNNSQYAQKTKTQLKMNVQSNFRKFRTNIRSRLSDIKSLNEISKTENEYWKKKKDTNQIEHQEPTSGRNVWPTANTKWSISFTETNLDQTNKLWVTSSNSKTRLK